MPYKHSLRFRLVFSYFVLSGVIGSILLVIIFISLETMERQLVNEHVLDELAYFKELTDKNRQTTTLSTKKMRGFKVNNGTDISAYPFLTSLKPGLNTVNYDKNKYVVGVERTAQASLYLLYDVTDFEEHEYLLINLFLFLTLCAVVATMWYGNTVSGRLIAPVTNLAKQVQNLGVTHHEQGIAQNYANDEVGELAEAFDNYMERIYQFLEREQHFTADASHELRTPLAVILGAVELILVQQGMPDKIKEPLLRIERAAIQMQQNLTALLCLARETSSNESTHGRVNISMIATGVLETLQADIQNTAVQVQFEQLADPELMVPEPLVQVLLSNLLRNALSYCHSGTVTISIAADQVSITDTGIGIPKADLPHIFERGYRGANTSGKGIGLGLSIVKRICERYGWTLDIDSTPGSGTRVIWRF